ncbi:hypothetical protein K504DRAFT_353366, partial [Pleomassaria siparia CBS 279.74]
WRFGVFTCAACTFAVFLINLIVTIWAALRYGSNNGQQVLFEGDCGRAGRLNTTLHVGINILGSVLLSSSNYCMQCLSAPTRKEVDKAHAKEQWLDIGILSTRNLRGISRKRVAMWWILAVSSLPLHLFYNSVVFSSIVSNWTWPVSVNPAFVASGPSDNFTTFDGCEVSSTMMEELRKLHSRGELERLDNLECINAYARQYQTRGNVLLVSESSNSSGLDQLISFYSGCGGHGKWVCSCSGPNSPPCDMDPTINELRSDPTSWSPMKFPVSYCLSERAPERCKVQSSLHLAIVVIVLNLVKAFVMFILATQTKETPFMTVGDAIASYIEEPDYETRDMCLASRAELKKQQAFWIKGSRPFEPKRERLFASASTTRWAFCVVIYVLVLATIGGLLGRGVHIIRRDFQGGWDFIWKIGVGKASAVTTIDYSLPTATRGTAGLLSNVLIANSPQPILSCIYFMYNGLFTAMSGTLEWESFAQNRKGLRVSGDAVGNQRSTYFLSLPYRFGIPLVALSSVLHWLVSQAIFLVNIDNRAYRLSTDAWESYEPEFDYESESNYEFSCGYSPLAIIFTLIVGFLMTVGLVGFGSFTFKRTMPVVANCSAAIAAACHIPAEHIEKGTSGLKVQWGVTGYDENGIGHCSFSHLPVEIPLEGQMY